MSAPLLLPDSLSSVVPGMGGMSSTTPSVNPQPTIGQKPIVTTTPITPAPKPSTAPTSGTVLSNANVIENTIPSLNQRANAYQPNAPTILADSGNGYGPIASNPNDSSVTARTQGIPAQSMDNYMAGTGSAANPANSDETQDPVFQQEMDLINGLRTSNDDTSNAAVDSIMRNYQNLANNLTQAQQGPDAMVTNALLRGGTSRYAPGNAAGILSAQHYADIDKIGQLQDDENAKIAAVRQAQATQNYSLVEKTLSELDGIRADKQAATQALATKMQAASDQQTQAKRDSAVASLVAQGVTDPTQLLETLNTDAQGNMTGDFTADEISKTLAAIQKNTGITDLSSLSSDTRDFFVLKENNQLPGDIGSLPENQQLSAFLKQQYSDTHAAGSSNGSTPAPTTFTATQSNKGAANAGVAVTDFDKFDSDTKNYFVNNYSNFEAALKKVGTAKPDGSGNFTLDDLKTAIDAAPISDDGKNILYKKAGIDPNASGTDTAQAPQSSIFSGIESGMGSAVDYVKNLFKIP